MDETFRSFFGFDSPKGYLCYAAVGIPEPEYKHFKRTAAAIFSRYEAYVVGDSGTHLNEFKFEDFKQLPREQREKIAGTLGKAIKSYGGFVVAFYTHVAGVVMECVRSNLVGKAIAVPADHNVLYNNAAAELRREMEGVAQSKTIARILKLPLAGLAQFLSYFQCPFQLICDPRESKEDKAVLVAIDEFFRDHMTLAAPDQARSYEGMDNTRPSVSEMGIQMADLLAGEVRSLFQAHPALLNESSTPDLISSDSREDAEWWELSRGTNQKLGSMAKISPELLHSLREPDGTNCLPLYRYSLAAGMLSCYTDIGQPRHIEVFEGNFFNQTD